MKKQIWFIIFVLCLFSSFALNDLGTFKLGEDINLIQLCEDCSYNNISSVMGPNSKLILNEVKMTKVGTHYNYTLGGGNVTKSGTYNVNGHGDLGGNDQVWAYTFTVTPSGVMPTTAQGIMYVFLLVIVTILLVISIVAAVTINVENKYDIGGGIMQVNFNKYYRFGLFFLSYLLLIFVAYLAYGITETFLFLDFAGSVFKTIHEVLWVMVIPVFMLMVLFALLKYLLDLKLQKLAKRNLPQRNGGRK